MKFKITTLKQSDTREPLSAVEWNGSEEVFSCGDDRILLKWNLLSKDTTKLCEFLENVYPIDMHNFTRQQSGIKRQTLEQILLTSADGINVAMKFKITTLKQSDTREPLSAVEWNGSEEVFSCGDDRILLKWNLLSKDTTKLCEFSENVYPIDMHNFTRQQSGIKRQTLEQILLTSADGKFHIIGKSGRIEKSVEAHRGAVLVGKWSTDGSSLLTGGEDGQIKIWSRSGMLRSTIAQEATPIYSVTWSPDSNQILFTSNRMLVMKSLSANLKSNRWKAHEGLILKVSWNVNNNLIISGSEDCRYKVWDVYGRQLYASVVHDHPITSLGWAPAGDFFAVGSFNTLRLCDKTGWSHSLEMPDSGSIYSIAWSSDGTQVACAGANGNLLLAHIIERRLEWLNYELTLISKKCLQVRDIRNDTVEKLDFPERVILTVIGYKRIIAATPAQCYVYNISNLNTPHIMELKEGAVTIILIADKLFALVEKSSVNVYSYDGRHLFAPKWPNMQCDTLNANLITLSNDTIAIRDQIDEKVIHLLEIGSTTSFPAFAHKIGISEIGLSQGGSVNNRLLAFVDKNRDLFVMVLNLKMGATASRKIEKLGIMIQSIFWNQDHNILAGIQETTLTVWCYPAVIFVDRRLLRRSTLIRDTSELGRNPTIINFIQNHINIRRSDGSVISTYISPFISILHSHSFANNWQNALKLCRTVKDEVLWTCLAALAVHNKDLDTAEEAYAAIDLLDKVSFVQFIKTIKNRSIKMAETALLGGNVEDAESILLQNGLIFRAIYLNICMHHWTRFVEKLVLREGAGEMELKPTPKSQNEILFYIDPQFLSLGRMQLFTNCLLPAGLLSENANIQCSGSLEHFFKRALDLAVKHKTHVDTVLMHRQKYLLSFDKVEKNNKFLQFKEMEFDEKTVEQKVAQEFQKESITTK